MPPRKILFIAPTGQLGGAERCLVDTIWSLHQSHPEMEMQLVVGTQGPLIQSSFDAGLHACQFIPLPERVRKMGDSGLSKSLSGYLFFIMRVLISVPSLIIYLIRLRELIGQQNPTIVHVLGLKMQLLSLLIVPRQIPIVWNIQDYIGQRRLIQHLFRLFMALFGRNRKLSAGCCSDDVTRDFANVLGQKHFMSINTVYNTVDLEKYQPLGITCPEISSNPSAIKIGLVATYARWKGHDIFIKALAEIAKDDNLPAWHAFIVGGPIYDTVGSQWSVAELQSLASSLDISNQITFIPFQPDAAAVMRSLDIVVHASKKPEPFGRVIAEAQAAGRAVVAVGSGGSAEVFLNHQTGLAIAMNDVASLATALRLLISEPATRQNLAENGRSFVIQKFNRKDLARHWLAIYESLCQPN